MKNKRNVDNLAFKSKYVGDTLLCILPNLFGDGVVCLIMDKVVIDNVFFCMYS